MCWYTGIKAQPNLVPNPSFEEYTSCPSTQGAVFLASPWYVAHSSPDYFNACSISSQFVIPDNVFGHGYAYEGSAYVGAGIWLDNGDDTSPIECIAVPLNEVLLKDVEYCYSFYVMLADSSMYTSPDIQIAFAKDSVYVYSATQATEPLRIIYNDNDIFFSKTNWIMISGDFVAEGWERHMVICNFKKHNETLVDSIGGADWVNGVYPLIDMINLTYCNPYNEPSIPNVFTPNGDSVNDLWFIEDSLEQVISVKIYNRWGNIVFEKNESPFEWDGYMNGNNKASDGVYFYVLRYYAKPNKIREKSGVVHIHTD